MKHLPLLFALLALTACAGLQEEEFVVVEPISEEPVIVEEPADAPIIKRSEEVCPQSGDGIGGTGCPDKLP